LYIHKNNIFLCSFRQLVFRPCYNSGGWRWCQVRFQVSLCVIYRGQSGKGAGFFPSHLVSSWQYHSTSASYTSISTVFPYQDKWTKNGNLSEI